MREILSMTAEQTSRQTDRQRDKGRDPGLNFVSYSRTAAAAAALANVLPDGSTTERERVAVR